MLLLETTIILDTWVSTIPVSHIRMYNNNIVREQSHLIYNYVDISQNSTIDS